ncbi:argininosuccinate lyase [Sphingomonas sp. Leaf23]|uniref:LPS translocon maturation chaperone LptM n=1 Tax=Sphingomonas sp. Leaf23 TaxID=1735689 RepID=UPI0006FD1602|nr:lipoprotein [Sphingomonas sp. Leaf23]KQM87451.1 argininosuccinate lyase [Sphingomonas sp. Leaf23]
MRGVALLAVALALAGCGQRRDLHPQENASLPPAPYGATTQPTSGELLNPTTQQRPSRSDELLTESKARGDDPFALPPR